MTYSADLATVVDDVLLGEEGAEDLVAWYEGVPDVWTTMARLGWPLIGIVEEHGGVGGSLADCAEVVAGLGRHGVAAPLMPTQMGAWLLAETRGAVSDSPETPLTVGCAGSDALAIAPAREGWVLRGELAQVPWLLPASWLLVLLETPDGLAAVVPLSASVSRAGLEITSRRDMAGEPTSRVGFDDVGINDDTVVRTDVPYASLRDRLCIREAVLRSAALSGAAQQACQLTAAHVTSRNQFGAPLIRLQAVGHGLAAMVAERDLMIASVHRAVTDDSPAAAAAARAVTARGAGLIAAQAHQLHGAIGITQEYRLQRVTRQLWSWRDQSGSQRWWEERLAKLLLSGEKEAIWGFVTEGSDKGSIAP